MTSLWMTVWMVSMTLTVTAAAQNTTRRENNACRNVIYQVQHLHQEGKKNSNTVREQLLEDIQSHITTLQTEMLSQKSEIQLQRNKIHEQDSLIKEQESKIKSQEIRIQRLAINAQTLKTTLQAQEYKMAALESEREAQALRLQSYRTEMEAMESSLGGKLGILQNQVNLITKSGMRKAFHAEGSQRNIPVDGVIIFGRIRFNVHGGYNPRTSKFTCNNQGLYLFYVTLAAYNGRDYGAVWYQIVQDGHIKANGYTGDAKGAVSTQVAMIRCSPGSQIWVKQGHYRSSVKQGMWEGHSQFGGFELA